MVEQSSYNPWAVVNLVTRELDREGLQPRMVNEDISQARQAAIDLLDALNVPAEVPEAGEPS